MFTGIVEKMGKVKTLGPVSRLRSGSGFRIFLNVGPKWDRLPIGSSVAVDGVCLTVSGRGRGVLSFDLLKETLKMTRFSSLRAGDRVNLERALRVGRRIEGHFVQGHVDGTGKVLKVLRRNKEKSFLVSFPKSIKNYILPKGSIALNGVSLTIGKIQTGAFWVYVIPHTSKKTNLGLIRQGDHVNLEADVLLKFWRSKGNLGTLKY